jgi:hypothetical protein
MFSPASLTFSSQTVGTSRAAQSITLTNSGNATLNITGITITGANAADYSETSTCGATLAASATCSISVVFKPTAAGTRTAAVSFADNASNNPQSVALSGAAVTPSTPAATLTPASLSFASQIVDTSSAAKAITLTNAGSATLNITGISIAGTNTSDYSEITTCGATLAANANCTISVTFKPTATGTRTASVSIADNAGGSPQTVSLSGTATAPDFSLNATPVSITVNAGQSATATISVVPADGFNQPVSLSCSGLPSGVTCAFSPNSVTPGGGTVSSNLTLSAASSLASAPALFEFKPGPLSPGGLTSGLLAMLAAMFLFFTVNRRQMPGMRRLGIVVVLLVLGSMGLLTGCAGGKAPLNATVTVSGTSGSGAAAISHTATISLTVKR